MRCSHKSADFIVWVGLCKVGAVMKDECIFIQFIIILASSLSNTNHTRSLRTFYYSFRFNR